MGGVDVGVQGWKTRGSCQKGKKENTVHLEIWNGSGAGGDGVGLFLPVFGIN